MVDSVTIGGVTLSRGLVEAAYAQLHPQRQDPSPVVTLPDRPTFYGVPLVQEPISEPVAREWARANVDQIVDIPIRKHCEYCGREFVTCLYSGLISPRYCTRKCCDDAHPFVPMQFPAPSKRERKKRAKKP